MPRVVNTRIVSYFDDDDVHNNKNSSTTSDSNNVLTVFRACIESFHTLFWRSKE